ncbi:MAG TPA: sulfatase-like hydrolase/transferase [Devosiaceae bacterium]
MAKRPNMVFILSDQHSRRVLGCYGNTVAQTPNIDRIAARGVTFRSAYCASPICTPSRMSLLTGRWPHEQHCWTLEDALASDIPTFAHGLGAAGYKTILCGRMHAIGPDQLHGFDERHVGDCAPNWLGSPRQDLGVLAGAQGPSPHGEGEVARSLRLSGAGQSGYEVVDDATTEAACETISRLGAEGRQGKDQPFLLCVGYLLPHCPFVARPDDFEAFSGVELPEPLPKSSNENSWIDAWRRSTGLDKHDPAAARRARTAYYGMVRALDRKIGLVLDALEREGLLEDTLIIYASDHGEHLGDHDLWWKNTFHEESVSVPLVVSWPGSMRQGVQCDHVVNLVDIGATLLDAAGAVPLPRSRGRSLLAIGANPRAEWVDETFSEYVTDLSSAWTGPQATQQRMIRQGRWKYVHIAGHPPQLFDLERDPNEAVDLGLDPAHQTVRRRLSERVLDGWDPAAIEAEVAIRCAEKAVLREWGRRTDPPSRYVFAIRAEDSWLQEPGSPDE